MKSSIQTICVFDLETTGISPQSELKELNKKSNKNEKDIKRIEFLNKFKNKKDPSPDLYCIAEIACCPFNIYLDDLKEYQSNIIKPYEIDVDKRSITDGALNVNGISRKQLEGGRSSKEVADEFAEYLKRLKTGTKKPILAGHNILKFDIPFLENFMLIHGYNLRDLANLDYSIETMLFAWLWREEMTNYKLGTCCEEAGIELNQAHRAIYDTRSNKNLVKEYIRSMRNSSSEKGEEYVRPKFQF